MDNDAHVMIKKKYVILKNNYTLITKLLNKILHYTH